MTPLTNKIICGDALQVLKEMPDESIDCVMTSPPYWALRDYGTAVWEGGDPKCEHKVGRATRGGLTEFQKGNKGSFGDEAIKTGQRCPHCGAKRIDRQLGLEPTFQEYITKLCDIFDEVKRVLKKTGTCWVNMGDTYGGSGKGVCKNNTERLHKDRKKQKESWNFKEKPKVDNYISKSLCQIPSRFAIEMTNRGWILRNEIVWHKPNCMPSSARDRFTVDFEKLFFFVKSKKYWFETQYEPFTPDSDMAYRQTLRLGKQYKVKGPYEKNTPLTHKAGHRDWQQGMNERGKDAVMQIHLDRGRNKRCVWRICPKPFEEAHFAVYPEELCEIPIMAGCPEKGIALDPFAGAGTTAVVAKKLVRNYIGIELNPAYVKMSEERLRGTPTPLF